MSYENLIVEINDGIQKIIINRPSQLNALNTKTFEELEDAMQLAYENPMVMGVLITGSGDKSFVAGADIKEFADFSVEEGEELSRNGHRIFKIIEDCPKPVIAAINGFALGGGLELAMSCHMRVASDNARFGQPEVALGVIPGYAGTQRLTQLIGKSKSFEYLMTGEMFKADVALNLGLVNYVTTPEELEEKVMGIFKKIGKQSPVAIAGVVKCVNSFYKDGEDGFNTECVEFGRCFGTEDFKEGTTAFMEKRKASFPGK